MTLIKKYWKAGLWSYFTNKQNNDIITLFRTLMNNSNYNLYSKQIPLTFEIYALCSFPSKGSVTS